MAAEVGEHVARAKATHPRVCGDGYGAFILPHNGDEARTRGGHAMREARAKATPPKDEWRWLRILHARLAAALGSEARTRGGRACGPCERDSPQGCVAMATVPSY